MMANDISADRLADQMTDAEIQAYLRENGYHIVHVVPAGAVNGARVWKTAHQSPIPGNLVNGIQPAS